MSTPLLLIVGGIYLMVAWGYVDQQRYGMALAFVAYAIANLGFALDAR